MSKMPQIKISHLKPNAQNIKMWIAVDTKTDLTVGHVFLNIEANNKLKFMDDWVHPDYRNKGIYKQLWDVRMAYVEENYDDHLIYAWCKQTSLPLFLKRGFEEGETATYVEYKQK